MPFSSIPIQGAWANEINNWSKLLKSDVVTLSTQRPLIRKIKNYLIFKRGMLGIILFFLYIFISQYRYELLSIEASPTYKKGLFVFLAFFRILKIKDCAWRLSKDWLVKDENILTNIALKLFGRILPMLKYIFVLDEKTKKYLKEKGIDKNVYFITGVDVNLFKDEPCSSSDSFIFLFGSSPTDIKMIKHKGIMILKQAMKKIILKYDYVKLVLINRGGKNTNYLKSIFSDLPDKYVEIKYENNSQFDMTNRYREINAAIFIPIDLKYSRNYPFSIMESIACGRPVIVSNNLEISKIVEEQNCGIVTNATWHGIASAMEECMVRFKEMKINCRNIALKYFDINNNIKEFIKDFYGE